MSALPSSLRTRSVFHSNAALLLKTLQVFKLLDNSDIESIKARQSLGLPFTGRLTEQQVKRAHKLLAIQHHPDKGGDPEMMTRFNNARDALLEPEMEAIPG